MRSRKGGDAADRENPATNNISMQELASAGPSAIESFGPEPGGSVVRVDFERPGEKTLTVRLRCGLHAAGGES
jgi:hypothetical protein